MNKRYVVIAAFAENWLPMVLKNRPQYLKGLLNLPGGSIEYGEHPKDAAFREMHEETGLSVTNLELRGMIFYEDVEIYAFSAKTEKKTLTPRPIETEDTCWYNVKELFKIKYLAPNLRLVLPLLCNGVNGWKIECTDWKGKYYYPKLSLVDYLPPIEIKLPGLDIGD
jgi:8-oxo-dGTP diphosphatase